MNAEDLIEGREGESRTPVLGRLRKPRRQGIFVRRGRCSPAIRRTNATHAGCAPFRLLLRAPISLRGLNVSEAESPLKPNTYAYESEPMVKATGFREYDARWLFGSEINLMGVEALGLGLGTLIHELGRRSRRSSPATISAPIRPRSRWR